MRDRFYRLRDIPPHRRLSHFWEYYKLQLLLLLVVGSSAAYLVYGLLRPDPDLLVLWMSGEYTYEKENALRSSLSQADWLDNQKKKPLLTYIEFAAPYKELSYQTMSEINTLVGGQQYSFFLVGGPALEWMEQNGILGTWSDAGIEKEGYLIVPLSELPLLSGPDFSFTEELYLTVSAPDTGKNTAAEYARQSEALRRFLSVQGIS